ncbi:MAG TPA: NmrA family NAD(P)-binding protein [Xanthobacteraceae bacterium]|jgi:uncharacterized protein YbjT (DUF2867 family)
MYAITGITGKVGGSVARALLNAGQSVRAVVRDREKGKAWAALGCEIAIASIEEPGALTEAFRNVDGVFLMTPPDFDPAPGFPATHANAAAIKAAITTSRPGKIVFLSTVGAQVAEPNLLNNSRITEAMLRTAPVPVGILRAAWFMENAAWDVEAARSGSIPSFLQPLDHTIPMVSTSDIGTTAARMLREHWSGVHVVELEGPRRYSANDIAAGFAAALGHEVRMEPVPPNTCEALFRAQGMKNPIPRIRMIDGFNEGWIDFEGGAIEHRRGTIPLNDVLKTLVPANR